METALYALTVLPIQLSTPDSNKLGAELFTLANGKGSLQFGSLEGQLSAKKNCGTLL